MTVAQLIECLKHMPQDVPIVDLSGFEVDGAHEKDEFCLGDSANPNNPLITVVQLE